MKQNIFLIADRESKPLAQELLQGNIYRTMEMKKLIYLKEMYSGIIVSNTSALPGS